MFICFYNVRNRFAERIRVCARARCSQIIKFVWKSRCGLTSGGRIKIRSQIEQISTMRAFVVDVVTVYEK